MADFEKDLARAKSESLLQSLFRSTRLLQQLALARKQAKSDTPQPRTAHAALYAHISLSGTRPSVLAAKLGVTPQAVAQLVSELESMGLVERVPDPDDRRARLVRFTKKGREDILEGFAVFAEIERELRAQIGAREYDRLHALLERLESAAAEIGADP